MDEQTRMQEAVVEMKYEAQCSAREAIRNGATAPWGNGTVTTKDDVAHLSWVLETQLGVKLTTELLVEYRLAFLSYFNRHAPREADIIGLCY